MGKQFCLKLLIVCTVFGQGIVVSSEKNIDSSSDLLNRQKRASSSTTINSPEPLLPYEIPKWVHVVSGEEHYGLGIVIHPRIIVTRASIFHAGVDYQVMFSKQNGDYERFNLSPIIPNKNYAGLHERPLGKHDVALAVSSGDMPKYDLFLNTLLGARYTPEHIKWIVAMLPAIKQQLGE